MTHIHSSMLRSWERLFRVGSNGMSFCETERNLIHDLQLAAATIDYQSENPPDRRMMWVQEFLDWSQASQSKD